MTDELKKQPAPEESAPVQETPAPAADQTPLPEPAAEETASGLAAPKLAQSSPWTEKLKDYARKGAIVLILALLVFLAGFALDHFLLYRPTQASLSGQIAALEGDLDDAKSQIENLEQQGQNLDGALATANQRIETLESQNAGLQETLQMADMQIVLLQTVSDLNAARIALLNEDVSGAKVALLETQARLEILLPLIETVDSSLSANLLTRFELVTSALDKDPETASADLGLLAQNLLNIEKLLFTP
jgi:hypothetical protein